MDKKILYRQIDFLRLFRLCKEHGVAKRKRKMPSEYDRISKVRATLRRLLRAFLDYLFPNFTIKSDYYIYFLTISREDCDILNGMASKNRTFFENAEGGEEALQKWEELRQSSDYIQPRLPHEIKIYIENTRRTSRYHTLVDQGIRTQRPRENFYQCALECLEFQKKWYEYMAFIRTFYLRESQLERQREEEARQAQRDRRRQERERLRAERENQEERDKQREELLLQLQEQMRQQHANQVEYEEEETTNQNAQETFNRALQEYMRQ